MTRTTTDRPTDAEMIQTACRRGGSAILAVEGADATPIDVVHLFESQAFVLVPTDGDARWPMHIPAYGDTGDPGDRTDPHICRT